MLEHNENGTLGLIINRPLDVPLGELWEDCPHPLNEHALCAEGGPVERHKGLLLHGEVGMAGSHELAPGIAVGGDVDALDCFRCGSPNGPRLFLGHAGWEADQLSEEVASGSWMVRDGHPRLLLDAEPAEDLWSDLVNAGEDMPPPSAN